VMLTMASCILVFHFFKLNTALKIRHSEICAFQGLPPHIKSFRMSNSKPSGNVFATPLKAHPSDTICTKKISVFPCGDELDKRILSLAVPATMNLAIVPLVGAVDTFWTGRMSNTLALAGQSAANQIFSSASWIISFLPSVITPLIAQKAGAGNREALQQHVGESIFIGIFLGILGTVLISFFPNQMLSMVLKKDAPAMKYASVYLSVRGLTFLPALISTIGFAAFRGTLNVVTPLKIALVSNLINVILDPILIFNAGMGVAGAAAATCISEIISFILYAKNLVKRDMLKVSTMFRLPSWESMKPLLVGGLAVQCRAVAMNIAFLAVTRRTQALDSTGVAAAAHAISIQFWQLGGIFLLAMSAVASIIVPNEVAKSKKEADAAGLLNAKGAADRLLVWGVVLGFVLAAVQIGCLPLLNIFSPLENVQQAAKLPSIMGALLQLINGVVFVGEGIQQGNQHFISLAASSTVATIGMLTFLKFHGHTLAGVWGGFAVFNLIRLVGVLRHHFFTGPLTSKKVRLSAVAVSIQKEEVDKVETICQSNS